MFRRLVVYFMMGGQASYQDTSDIGSFGESEAFEVYFNAFGYESDKRVLRSFRDCLVTAKIGWIYERSGAWVLDPAALRTEVPDFELPEWLNRQTTVEVEVLRYEDEFGGQRRQKARVFLRIDEADMQKASRIFLSHKSVDKELVRKVATALDLTGLSPWLDERDMSAGAHLERSLAAAFRESFAAVFFVTSSYEDAGFLSTEVDYAIREKRARGEFAIITVRISAPNEKPPEIPILLQSYVWKDARDGLEALIEILRAIPNGKTSRSN